MDGFQPPPPACPMQRATDNFRAKVLGIFARAGTALRIVWLPPPRYTHHGRQIDASARQVDKEAPAGVSLPEKKPYGTKRAAGRPGGEDSEASSTADEAHGPSPQALTDNPVSATGPGPAAAMPPPIPGGAVATAAEAAAAAAAPAAAAAVAVAASASSDGGCGGGCEIFASDAPSSRVTPLDTACIDATHRMHELSRRRVHFDSRRACFSAR